MPTELPGSTGCMYVYIHTQTCINITYIPEVYNCNCNCNCTQTYIQYENKLRVHYYYSFFIFHFRLYFRVRYLYYFWKTKFKIVTSKIIIITIYAHRSDLYCIHTCICRDTYITYIVRTCTHVHTYTYTYTYIHIHTYIHMYSYMYVCICTGIDVDLMLSACCCTIIVVAHILPFSHSLPPNCFVAAVSCTFPFQSSRALGCENGRAEVLALQLLFIWHDVAGADRHSYRQRHTVSAAY